MKTKYAILLLWLVSVPLCFGEALITMMTLTKTNTSATVPVQLSSSSIKFKSATVYGLRTAQTTNTSVVYLGTSSTNGDQMIAIAPTNAVIFQAPPGYYYNFTNIWLDVVTTNDGVVVIYDPL